MSERVDDTRAVWKDEALRGRERIAQLERELAEAREDHDIAKKHLKRMQTDLDRLSKSLRTAQASLSSVGEQVEMYNDDPGYEHWEVGDLHMALYRIRAALSAPAEETTK